jgi:hypothetical protein
MKAMLMYFTPLLGLPGLSLYADLVLLQASVALPAMDTDVRQLPKGYAPAVHWSDYFWSLCFDR